MLQKRTRTSSTNTPTQTFPQIAAPHPAFEKQFISATPTVSKSSQSTQTEDLISQSTVALSELKRDLVGISTDRKRRRSRRVSSIDDFEEEDDDLIIEKVIPARAFTHSHSLTSDGNSREGIDDSDTEDLMAHYNDHKKRLTTATQRPHVAVGEPLKKKRKFLRRNADEPCTSSEALAQDWLDNNRDFPGSKEDHEDEMLMMLDEDDEEDYDDENPPGDRVAYIHVGEGGEADLEAQPP